MSTPGIGRVKPDHLVIAWQDRHLRIRHDDHDVGPYAGPGGTSVDAAVEPASDVEGLRLDLASTVGDRYRFKVSDDGSTVGLWRLVT